MKLLTIFLVLLFMTPPIVPAEADGVRRHHRSAKHRKTKVPAVAAWRDNDDDDDFSKRRRCLGLVRGLGTQWIGEGGALEAAKKDWLEKVRYDHGETYLDMNHAEDFEKRCGRTSIGEIAGQVLFRCEIVARPCKGEFDKLEGQK